MVKRVDVAVYQVIESVVQDRLSGGIRTFGLAQDGVGYVYDEHNQELIPDQVRTRAEQIRDEIIRGAIQVPTRVE